MVQNDTFSIFLKEFLISPQVNLTLLGTMDALAQLPIGTLSLTNILLHANTTLDGKQLYIEKLDQKLIFLKKGLNGLPGITVLSSNILSGTTNTLSLSLSIQIVNPTISGVELDYIIMSMYYGPYPIGFSQIMNFRLAPGTNTFQASATYTRMSNSTAERIFFSRFLQSNFSSFLKLLNNLCF